MTDERSDSDSDVNYEDDPEPVTDADLLDPDKNLWEDEPTEDELAAEEEKTRKFGEYLRAKYPDGVLEP